MSNSNSVQSHGHEAGHNAAGGSHGSVKSYLIGFVLAVILTVVPFKLVMDGTMPPSTVLPVTEPVAAKQFSIGPAAVTVSRRLSFSPSDIAELFAGIWPDVAVYVSRTALTPAGSVGAAGVCPFVTPVATVVQFEPPSVETSTDSCTFAGMCA